MFLSNDVRSINEPPTREQCKKHLQYRPAKGQEPSDEAQHRKQEPENLSFCGVSVQKDTQTDDINTRHAVTQLVYARLWDDIHLSRNPILLA